MNKNQRNHIKKETKGQIIFIVMMILAIAIGLIWNILEVRNTAQEWPGQVTSHPMTNANISWEQSFHGGTI